MASLVHKLGGQISCHCWSPDGKRVAVCHNNEQVVIYANVDRPVEQWTKEHVLKDHDLLVTAIDWSAANGKIVTCSHDRNAFVWTLTRGEWKPSLSILRINRAALSVKWSPDGTKFAVASGAKVVPICHYEKANDWWISKMIKKHKSTVIDVAWHPNSNLVATASSDFRCRIFSAFIPEVGGGNSSSPFGSVGKTQFGDMLAEFDSSHGWVESCNFSPSGSRLAFTGHDSTLHVVSLGGSRNSTQTIRSGSLPNQTVMFLSENVIVAAGHDFNPAIFQADQSGRWHFLAHADVKEKGGGHTSMKISGFVKARSLWANKTTRGQEKDTTSQDLWTQHTNSITCLKPYGDTSHKSKIDMFSTSGVDGKIIKWSVSGISKVVPDLHL